MVCHHEEVPTEMPASVQAYSEYKQTDLDVMKMRFRARARLGAVILRERTAENATQDEVAGRLGIVVNQVRRYEASYRQWQKDYPDEPVED